MSTLLFTLAGPMQSWGVGGINHRNTMPCPTLSGVCGLIAACMGMEWGSDLQAEFHDTRMSVREDEPPTLMSDFQTVGAGTRNAKVTTRDYLAGGAYTVALTADDARLDRWRDALAHPVHAVGLGRRSCPPTRPFDPQVTDDTPERLFDGSHWWTDAPHGGMWPDSPVRRDRDGGQWRPRTVMEHTPAQKEDFFDAI